MSEKNVTSWLHVTSWLQGILDEKVNPLLEKHNIMPVPKLRVLLSFPSTGGETVEPREIQGGPNPRSGEAKKKFQYLAAAPLSKLNTIEPERLNDPTFALVSHGGKVASDVPSLLISPAKHCPWSGSAYYGNDEQAEVAKRIETLLHGAIFAHVAEFAPEESKKTKTGKVKVYGGHFEKQAAKVGLMGKGWSPEAPLRAMIIDWAKDAPKGASINLFPPEEKDGDTTASVTLLASDGTEIKVSARAIASKKGGKAALDIMRTMGPFTYKTDSLGERMKKEAKPLAPQAEAPQEVVAAAAPAA